MFYTQGLGLQHCAYCEEDICAPARHPVQKTCVREESISRPNTAILPAFCAQLPADQTHLVDLPRNQAGAGELRFTRWGSAWQLEAPRREPLALNYSRGHYEPQIRRRGRSNQTDWASGLKSACVGGNPGKRPCRLGVVEIWKQNSHVDGGT